MNRGLRRDITMRKYISRIKKRLYYIFIKDEYRDYSKNIIINRNSVEYGCRQNHKRRH